MSHVKNHRGGVVDMGSHRVGHYIVVLVNQSRLVDQVTHVIRDSDNLQGRLCGKRLMSVLTCLIKLENVHILKCSDSYLCLMLKP